MEVGFRDSWHAFDLHLFRCVIIYGPAFLIQRARFVNGTGKIRTTVVHVVSIMYIK